MELTTIVILLAVVLAAVFTVLSYNGLVRLKHNVTRNWSNIDVSLKQRHDELPKLVEVCRQHMAYEQETLDRIVRARSAVAAAHGRADLRALGLAETELRAGLGQLFAVVENYPRLKANESFRHLAERITRLEETIADRRELYNESVNIHNIRIQQFPDLLIARLGRFRLFELLEFYEARDDVDLAKLFA